MLDLPLLDPRHRELASDLARFVAERIEPHAAAADASSAGVDAAARRFLATCAGAGWLRQLVPETYGGAARAPELRTICLVREALAAASAVADAAFAVQGLGSFPVALAASDALKRGWLPRVASGDAVAAFALTEPEAGSDAAAVATTARRDGDAYVLDGTKTLISNAAIASFFVVFARTSHDSRAGLSAFLVEADRPGIRLVRSIDLLAPHPIGELAFDGCRVPAAQRLGEEGGGLKLALATVDFFRASVGAAACGLARRALEEARARVLARRQFGAALATFQATRFAIADMATELDAARLLVYRAAWLRDHDGRRMSREASMAKLFATEAAQRIVDRAVQLHGGRGVERGAVVERLYREVRALRIYEGASEIQRLVIAGHYLKTPADPQSRTAAHDE